MPSVKQSLFRSSGAPRDSSRFWDTGFMDLLLLYGFPGLTNKLSSKHVTHWKEYMCEFKYSTFHPFWKWTLSSITLGGEIMIDKCSCRKVTVHCFLNSLFQCCFPPKQTNTENEDARLHTGKSVAEIFFYPLPFLSFPLIQNATGILRFFTAIPFKIHFQNLLREDLMESFSVSVGES